MNWKRNPTLFMGLCAALAVAIIIIFVLLVSRGRNSKEVIQQPFPPQRLPPPPQQQKNSEEDYQTTVGSGKPALVMFYADWCGHSKNMIPVWEKISQVLNQSGQFEVISLEQKKNGAEMQKYGVRGFPDIRFYPDGFPGQNSIPYHGDRSLESLMKFVQSGGQET
jgi:thiol-disulfide isomerase/thioredoxin